MLNINYCVKTDQIDTNLASKMNLNQKWHFKYGTDSFLRFSRNFKRFEEIYGSPAIEEAKFILCFFRWSFNPPFTKLKVETRSSGKVTDAAARTETTKHQFHLLESNMRKFLEQVLHGRVKLVFNQRDLTEWILVQGCCSEWGPFRCVEWGQRSAVTRSDSEVISERCVKQKPAENNCTCFYLRVQIQSRWRVNKWI